MPVGCPALCQAEGMWHMGLGSHSNSLHCLGCHKLSTDMKERKQSLLLAFRAKLKILTGINGFLKVRFRSQMLSWVHQVIKTHHFTPLSVSDSVYVSYLELRLGRVISIGLIY